MRKKIIDFFLNGLYLLRVAKHLKRCWRLVYKKEYDGLIYVLGNGPSLNDNLCLVVNRNEGEHCFALNDFAASDAFIRVKPDFYIMVDPCYWIEKTNERDKMMREKVFANMNAQTDWIMELIIPDWVYKKKIMHRIISNSNIKLSSINYTNFHPSYTCFYKWILKHNLGVVPVGNILGQAIYSSINKGFNEIRIFGADHSWTIDVRVNDKNEVCTIKRYFFETGEPVLEPWHKADTTIFKMHEVLSSISKHFYGYLFLDWYAKQMGCKVFNSTKDSLIDAFERKYIK